MSRSCPEAGEPGVVEVPSVAGRDVRREEDPDAAVLAGPDGLLDGAVGIEQGDVRDRVQATRIGLAELDQPSVVGAGVGGGQAGIRDVPFPADADGRIEEHAVDPLGVHHGEPRVRVVAAGRAALRVGDLAPGEQALGVHLDAAE
jgi:hypothetical protein